MTTGGEDRTAALKFWLIGTAGAVWVTGDLILLGLSVLGFCVAVYLSAD